MQLKTSLLAAYFLLILSVSLNGQAEQKMITTSSEIIERANRINEFVRSSRENPIPHETFIQQARALREAIEKVQPTEGIPLAKLAEIKSDPTNSKEILFADLRQQFGPEKNQGQVGSCRTFATMGILEAAYYRQYGERISLSEMSALRMSVLEVLSGISLQGRSSAIYMGMNPDEILYWIRRGFICESKFMSYDESLLGTFDSMFRVGSTTNQRKLRSDLRRASEMLESQEAPRCLQNASEVTKKMILFHDFEVALPSTESILEFLRLGIPIGISVGAKPSDFLVPTTGRHALVAVGFNLKSKSFLIRNSWGNKKSGSYVRFERVLADMQDIQNSAQGSGHWSAHGVLTPNDLLRLCGRTKLPEAIESECRWARETR